MTKHGVLVLIVLVLMAGCGRAPTETAQEVIQEPTVSPTQEPTASPTQDPFAQEVIRRIMTIESGKLCLYTDEENLDSLLDMMARGFCTIPSIGGTNVGKEWVAWSDDPSGVVWAVEGHLLCELMTTEGKQVLELPLIALLVDTESQPWVVQVNHLSEAEQFMAGWGMNGEVPLSQE